MLHQTRVCTLLILMFVNGLLSYELLHIRREATAMNDDDQMFESEDITRVEENLESNFFQGDILTTPEQKKNIDQVLFHNSHDTKYVDKPKVRGLVKDLRKTWTNGLVNYVIDDSLPETRKKMIEDAIEHWKQRTCLKFKERTTEPDYVNFQSGLGCSSYVGRIQGKQRLVVGSHCKLGNVIHEIGHAIGFFHEMSRPDRDEFVKINWKHIIPSRIRNFLKFSTNTIDSRSIPYDYNSIMHYSKVHFSKDRGLTMKTIVPTKDPTAYIGQRLALSVLDVKQANLLYNCGTKLKKNKNTDPNMMPEDDMDSEADVDISAVH